MSEELEAGKISVTGSGEVSQTDPEKEIVLPPMPEGAIEYGQRKAGNSVNEVELADLDKKTYEVSNVDDTTKGLEVINEPLIVKDATLTPANPEKEFVPKTQPALADIEEEGGISKVTSNGGIPVMGSTVVKELEKSEDVKSLESIMAGLAAEKTGFNPSIQNALTDTEHEGGVVSPKSTGSVPNGGDYAKDGFQNKSVKESDVKDKYRLYGFVVQFSGGDNIITRNVSDYFDDIEIAKYSINNGKYLMPTSSGAYKLTDIVSGLPELSLNDQQLFKYQNLVWRKY